MHYQFRNCNAQTCTGCLNIAYPQSIQCEVLHVVHYPSTLSPVMELPSCGLWTNTIEFCTIFAIENCTKITTISSSAVWKWSEFLLYLSKHIMHTWKSNNCQISALLENSFNQMVVQLLSLFYRARTMVHKTCDCSNAVMSCTKAEWTRGRESLQFNTAFGSFHQWKTSDSANLAFSNFWKL